MGKKSKTDIVCILDKSGSMTDLTDATISGFNEFIEDQQKLPGSANVTLVLFNSTPETVFDNKPINEVPKLTRETYKAMGLTALLDAVGSTIESVKARHKAGEKPDNTIFCIVTDGHENRSQDYKKARVNELIKKRQKKGWTFFFLGANIDSFAEAGGLGIVAATTVDYSATNLGTRAAYNMVSKGVTETRGGGELSDDWKDTVTVSGA